MSIFCFTAKLRRQEEEEENGKSELKQQNDLCQSFLSLGVYNDLTLKWLGHFF